MKEIAPTPLQIPEIAISIIGYLDPPTVLSIRLVSIPINTLILTHQRCISRSIAQRQFLTDIDWPPPDLDCLQKNFPLKTLTRFPKAYTLARRANKNLECYAEAGRARIPGKRHVEGPVLKVTSLYPTFLGRCARAILIIWTLNDIRQYLDESEPLPSYVPPSPPSRQGRLGRLLSRMTMFNIKSDSASAPPIDANAQTLSLYMSTLKPRSKLEFQKYFSALEAARQKYLNALPRNHRIDLVWVQNYLFLGLSRGYRTKLIAGGDIAFALHQGPGFILSLSSDDQCEKVWARTLARNVIGAREFELSFDEWERTLPIFFDEEEGREEEVRRAKAELTRGDWRNRGEAALET